MDTEYLRTFSLLCSTGSYAKTSQHMHVVPSTVSKHIMHLETEVGRPLVLRDKKGIKLTPAGEILLQYANRALKEESRCFDALDSLGKQKMVIRCGAVPSLFQNRVADWLAGMCKGDQKYRFRVEASHSQNLLNDLSDNLLDICFIYRSFRENNFVCIPFFTDELVLVTGEGDKTFSDGITCSELRKLPLLHESQIGVINPKLDKELFIGNENVKLSIGQSNFIVSFVKAGCGYGFVLKNYIRKEMESGLLRQIRILGCPRLFLQSYVVYKSTNGALSEDLLQNLRQYCMTHIES